MNTQHTPGPWDIRHGRCIYGSGDLIKPFVASVEDDHNDSETAANARLISAAPELLDAVRLALRALNVAPRFKVPGAGDSYEVCSELDRVLRKVEGAA